MGFGRNTCRRHAVVHACKALGDTAPFYLGRVPHCAGRGQRTSVGRMGRILYAQTLDVRGRQIRVFVALLPIACGAVYKYENKTVEGLVFPTLLPKAIRKKTNRATLIISVSLCIACVACYFTIAIVPEDNILTDAAAYPLGMGLAAILCLVIASIARVGKRTEAASWLRPLSPLPFS